MAIWFMGFPIAKIHSVNAFFWSQKVNDILNNASFPLKLWNKQKETIVFSKFEPREPNHMNYNANHQVLWYKM